MILEQAPEEQKYLVRKRQQKTYGEKSNRDVPICICNKKMLWFSVKYAPHHLTNGHKSLSGLPSVSSEEWKSVAILVVVYKPAVK